MRDLTVNFTEMKRVICDFYKQLFVKRLNDFDKMNKILKNPKNIQPTRLDTEKIENLNRYITSKKTESLIKS